MDCSKNIFDSIFTNVEADNYKRIYLTNKKYLFAYATVIEELYCLLSPCSYDNISYRSMMREGRENNGKSRRAVERAVNNCTNCTNKIKNKKTIDNSSRRMV